MSSTSAGIMSEVTRISTPLTLTHVLFVLAERLIDWLTCDAMRNPWGLDVPEKDDTAANALRD